MPTLAVRFPGAAGAPLAARLELPTAGRPRAWALFAHCFTCTKNIRAAVIVSRALAQRGLGVLRFDFTGLGESEGDFADTTFSSNVEDLLAAADFMEREHGAPSLLVGHSLGGAAVLRAAHDLASVRAVATIGAPADPAHVLGHLRDSLDRIEEVGEAEVSIGGRAFRVRRRFVDDLRASRPQEWVSTLDRALLLLHSPVDTVVGIENARRLYELARHPKSFVSLDDADHLLSRPGDAEYVGSVLTAWAERYLPAAGAEVEAAEPRGEASGEATQPADHVVAETGRTPYRTEIWARGHSLGADEPESLGGGDTGPTPYDLLLAGLGACTGITLRMYADRKGWPLETIRVALRHEKRHARDCTDCGEDRPAKLDHIERRIALTGELSDEQRARLMEIADKCPV
ncbi:MAG: alpha/beta fold hydrolase, partial [Gemmatimonadetes bacterium]